jgi:UDP-N-acetylmuramyl pentapeptide phosphotransferase/UDP-N-acetylglucosamine-1-phosphate transferase
VIKDFFLENRLSSKHKKITKSSNVYIIGGLIYLFSIFFLNLDIVIKLFLITIYFLGFIADKNIIKSASVRLFCQIITIYLLISYSEITINETRIILLDNLTSNHTFSIIFTLFCILILMNGSNFIDGVNLNLIGYYLVISLILYFISSKYNFILDMYNLKINMIFLILILLINSSGKVISGDSGAYLISVNFGLTLINFSNENPIISPFFIILLLWYPAFENLFSILRKIQIRKSALKPDFSHLHQLFFLSFNKRYKEKLISNNLSGLVIIFYNLLIFILSIKFISNTQVLVFFILFNIMVYIVIYLQIIKSIMKSKSIF